MTCNGNAKGQHRFQKFDETSLFCERCGERKVIMPAYVPDWSYRPPTWYPNWWYQPTFPPYTVWSFGSDTTYTTVGDFQSALTDGNADG